MNTSQRTLRSKKARALLYYENDGKCAMCGCDLPDDWHADHIEPWSKTHTTNLFGMQALCPACNLKKGDSKMIRWNEGLAAVGIKWPLSHDPYRAQQRFFEYATKPLRPVELVVLPTGYGKTICQIVYAAYLLKTGKVKHVIVLVPRDNLRSSMVEEWHRYITQLVPGAMVLNGLLDMYTLPSYARRGDPLVVIATYQQINDELRHFCRKFDCAVIADEAHHLYDEGSWADDTASLQSDHKMYFTATPIRGDSRPLRDVPVDQLGYADPLLQVTIREAQDEGALCKVRAIGVQFWIDVENDDGVYKVTTDELQRERVDFSTYEVRRQLRYAVEFTSPLIETVIKYHNIKHVQSPYKHQILVKAMSTNHADVLCQQINNYMQDDDFAHAVHIGKPAQENDTLLCRYRGVKRGPNGEEISIQDHERFPCLVQVDMAGEGYNNPYISTLAKADLTKGAPYITQLIGRALRMNYALGQDKQTVDVIVPDDDIATLDLIAAEFATEQGPLPEGTRCFPQDKRRVLLLDIPDVLVVDAGMMRAYELDNETSSPEDEPIATWANTYIPRWREFMSFAQVRSAWMQAHGGHATQRKDNLPETVRREQIRQLVDAAVGTLAGNVIRFMTDEPLRTSAKNNAAGNIKTAIHSQWIRNGGKNHKQSTAEDFQAKHEWLKSVNNTIQNQRFIPGWLQDAYYGRN